MMKNKQENLCFDGTTPIIYRLTADGEILTECIYDAYNKHKDDVIYVCTYKFNEDNTAQIKWATAKFCKTESIQMVNIYMIPDNISGGEEWHHIMRVTPNHVFPVLTGNGIKDVDAYLLETGDKLFSEYNRIATEDEYSEAAGEVTEEETVELDESVADVVAPEGTEVKYAAPDLKEHEAKVMDFILEEGSNQYVEIRKIAKVSNVMVTESDNYFGVAFYGITITDPDAPKHFVLGNNIITHDSSPRY